MIIKTARMTNLRPLQKCPTGIPGLDEVTWGGVPRGRTTLVCGSAGCGKTLFAVEFLVRGALQFQEPGVYIAFEETVDELSQNVASLGFDLQQLIDREMVVVDYIHLERSEIQETGEYDLEGLFVRIGHAIDTVKAKRVVLDTIEVLFAGLNDTGILRSEIRRLFRWLKDKGVTAVVTGERGEKMLTRFGLEEYVSDCVVVLDHRVTEQISTRRLRIVKYRGSAHGTNEFPFLLDENGISVVPITSARMDHTASVERISSGICGLDQMLSGKGYFRGSSILISGTAGTGKTSIATQFAAAACQRGERCLYFSFEESQNQLVRNMRSIGLDLDKGLKAGLLRIHSARPTLYGLEMHLALIDRLVREIQPQIVVVDPISNFISSGTVSEAGAMLIRLIDILKQRGITSLFTNLSHDGKRLENSELGVSSIIDTWIHLTDEERGDQRQGAIYVLKSRGMAHSKQLNSLRLSDEGIEVAVPSPGKIDDDRRSPL